MTADDVAIMDADETFTSRDFLRVLQVCDVPAFIFERMNKIAI